MAEADLSIRQSECEISTHSLRLVLSLAGAGHLFAFTEVCSKYS